MNTKELFFQELTADLSLSFQDLIGFSELFKEKHYSSSDYFVKVGEMTRFCGFVKNGIMRAYISDIEGEEANLRFVEKLGFISGSFAKGALSSLNIQSLVDCDVYIASWDSIFGYIKSHNTLRKFFNILLASGHYNIVQRLSTYLRNNAKQRYKLFLQEYPYLMNQIPHYHVANYLGITTVQLSRIRQKITQEKTDNNKC